MQDGVISKQQATTNLPRRSEHGGNIIHQCAQRGDMVGLQIAREGSADRAGGHSRTSSLGRCGAGSLILGHGTKDNANKDGVVLMVRHGEPVPVPRLRHGNPTLAQRTAWDGGPIVGASQVSLRVVLKYGPGQCRHAQASGGNARPAAVVVMSDTLPMKHLIRAWSQKYPQGISILNAEKPSNGTLDANTANPSTQCQPGGSGPQVVAPLPIPDIICAAMGQKEHGGVSSGGTQGANPFGPEMMRMYVATSTQRGRRVLSGDGAGREQPDARAPLGSPPRRSLNLGGRVRFIIGYL
jgi:hypothetical protein